MVLGRGILVIVAIAAPAAFGAAKPALAEDVFKNIQTFKGKPASSVIPAMDALAGLLGVECTYCHVTREWDRDDKPRKQTARRMFEMQRYLNETHFGGRNRISCWTCHRGHGKPEVHPNDPARVEEAKAMVAIPASDESKPAEQVFHNIQSLAGMPAKDLPGVMVYFSQALGVECSHCHVSGHWDQETPVKQTARKMLTMVDAAVHRFYGGSGPLGCPDCHQGSTNPEFLPAAKQ